ncbi:MAG: HAD-IA family hydrolase [Xanthobacteraceae bacterium]
MKKLHALLFDMDGTLVDTEELHRQAFNLAFLELQLGWDWDPELYAALLAISGGRDRIARYIDDLDSPPGEKTRLRRLVPAIHQVKTGIYRDLLGGTMVRLRPGVARLVEEARGAGLAIGIAATSASANVDALVSAAFDAETRAAIRATVSVDLVARRKPAPDIYELLLTMLGLPAADCVAFEDSCNGVAAAKAAGLFTVATPTRWTVRQDFTAADLVLPSLGDPQAPLERSAAARIGGAPCLGLAELDTLRSPGSGAAVGLKRVVP